jgi:hypothetical protein
MMRRFSNYAMILGHRNSGKWKNYKKRVLGVEAVPFIGLTPSGGGPAAPNWSQVNGAKMKDAVLGARVQSVGIGGRESITIRIPYGHPILPDASRAFRKIPQREIDGIAREVGAELALIIGSATPIAPKTRQRKPGAVPAPTARLSEKYAPRKVGGRAPRKVK